jgi:chorismate mutase-like protein
MSIQKLRKRIDALDARLVKLLNERTQVAGEIGKVKRRLGEEIYAPEREEDVLKRVTSNNRGPLTARSLRAIWREVMSASLALQKDVVISVFGTRGSFTDSAARQKFGGSVTYKYQPTFADVFREVAKGRADCGVVPIEDSTDGVTTHVCDLLMNSDLKICAQALFTVSGSSGASQIVARFFVIARKPAAPVGNDFTSVIFCCANRVGALENSLAAFRKHGVNLINIESRPFKNKPLAAFFFADLQGHAEDAAVQKALAELKRHSTFVKIAGSYPNQNG